MVFAGLFPVDAAEFQDLREAMPLRLNDASVTYEPETSAALGFGFRTGFLGLLHMEIIQERLEREFNLNLITTAPSVRYRVYLADGSELSRQPRRMPTRASTRDRGADHQRHGPPAAGVRRRLQLCQERRAGSRA